MCTLLHYDKRSKIKLRFKSVHRQSVKDMGKIINLIILATLTVFLCGIQGQVEMGLINGAF